MDDYLSDNEQWEWLRGWLKENGLWIIAGLVIGGLGIGGWRWWQARTDRLAVDGGARYEQVLEAFNAGDRSQGLQLIAALESEHAGSPYVDQANLAAARMFVEANELAEAAKRLGAVMQESHDPQLATIARLRLARVEIAMGRPDAALATLGPVPQGAFAARYHEVRGDAYFAKGERAEALDEYRAALLAGGPSLAENDVLNLKIDDLRGADGTGSTASGQAGTAPAARPGAKAAGAPAGGTAA
ncbi:MAG: YfgM family protein, partial [Steroidobacteraceae bacterium]